MRYHTEEDLREMLRKKTEGKKQSRVAGEIGVKPNVLSMALRGAPITGKIRDWLGFSKGPKVYVRQ
jgi:hypothetical protein